jgi:hypothetical protein
LSTQFFSNLALSFDDEASERLPAVVIVRGRHELSKKIRAYRTSFSAISELKHRRKRCVAPALARRVRRLFRGVERPHFNRLEDVQQPDPLDARNDT